MELSSHIAKIMTHTAAAKNSLTYVINVMFCQSKGEIGKKEIKCVTF